VFIVLCFIKQIVDRTTGKHRTHDNTIHFDIPIYKHKFTAFFLNNLNNYKTYNFWSLKDKLRQIIDNLMRL